MPTYVYKFIDSGETIEIYQAFSDDALTQAPHPSDGKLRPVKKVFTPVGITFKGGGFYKTDSATSGKTAASGTSASSATSTTGGSNSGPTGDTTSSKTSETSGSSGSDSSASTTTAAPATKTETKTAPTN